ncbi:PREDICTED: MATH domain and coiled-coil domain-containing protein At3g58440-like [Camelina sativa]|uniref:MATH domain and coiled-coil domain-containing protein At3g58440-like n=1 Tax=Camelina sativa TaxID=90675 RepID=A0ABM1QDU6_CAMSA|nr:PREDICTED: MATH domain and coiled-coil domain-containing protein At3g58440-like [Camelina sativa]
MSEVMEKKFTWVSRKLTTVVGDKCYSHPFKLAGCDWRLLASLRGYTNLSLYLELDDPASLPLGWRRDVKLRLTLVNKGRRRSNKTLGGQYSFDAKYNSWGFEEFLPFDTLIDPWERYMVSDRLIILAQVQVLPAIVVPVKIIEPQGHSSCQVAEATENASKENFDDDDASEEGMEDADDDASDEGSDDDDASEENSEDDDDDDASSPVSDDGGLDISSLSQSNASDDVSRSVGIYGISSNSVAAETEFSNCDNDDAPKEDVDDDTSSFVSYDSARNRSSLDQVKSLEDASQTAENGGRGLTMASVTGTSDNMLTETQPVKKTMDINGFEVFSSQVLSVRHIFERHPDIAVQFRAKNQHLRTTFMNFLASLIETLCQPLEELSNEDLVEADIALTYLKDVGFKVDWLEGKLNKVKEKKDKERSCEARVKELEAQLHDLKLKFEMEKAECNTVAAETEVSNSENDDAPKDNVDDEASSHVSNDSAITGKNGGRGLNTVASVTGTSEKMLMEIQRGKETMDVNGFEVYSSQTKLDEISKKKKMEQGSKARLQTMEDQLQKLKEMFLDLESQLHKEKVEALTARAPLSFNDVVC